MAEEFIPGLNASALMGATDGLTTGILWIFGVAFVGFVAWIIQYYLSFKIDCIIEEIVDGTAVVRADKIRAYKSKDGVPKWQIWGSLFRMKKDSIAIPSEPFIKLRANGRKFVTLFKTPAGDYLVVRNSKQLVNKIADYDEFTTAQRSMIIQEYREAQAYKPKDWHDYILPLTSLMALVIIVACFLIFFNDAVQPIINFGKNYVNSYDKMVEITERQVAIEDKLTGILANIDPVYLQELSVKASLNVSGSNTSAYVRPPN